MSYYKIYDDEEVEESSFESSERLTDWSLALEL